ncbi:(deoxy)nucleoside triphosphate pyrophosphohydrolase [Sphingomonas sp. CARO-RG-8B-R24-01]|uniref:(deoxy)nucleoside triphosphate pyrophosphohydrolase n=1 Tax=Sphingomonas sp. CARO-RG-8B-R24-01 TaxID=2914831 RepID=UPI001F5A3B8F|nr:(deoxy)nucleoside triphosphate pyrophosphohydrolase [Sphingomonas sp. CARO-RG-8B-R24-01]
MPKQAIAKPLLFVVAAGLVDDHGRVLVQQRPEGKALAGLWEFPGGKVEPGEAPELALVRELREELDVGVDPADLEPLTFASVDLADQHLLLLLYLCRVWTGAPRPLEASALAWHPPSALRGLAMPPADVPFIAMLETALAATG